MLLSMYEADDSGKLFCVCTANGFAFKVSCYNRTYNEAEFRGTIYHYLDTLI